MARLTAFDSIDGAALEALKLGLDQDAEEKNAPAYLDVPLSVLAHDEAGILIGGLTGKTFWNWLYIDILWVKKEARGKDIGGDMVRKAEAIALKRGCHSSYLWTESFQAPAFYQKLGYQKFVVKEDFPVGHQRIGFRKRLIG